MAHVSRSQFESAANHREFEDLYDAAVEAIANDPANAHLSDREADDLGVGTVDKFLEDAGLVARREALRSEALR
ncbi:hypothetical protein [Paracoccus sp. SSK6]|uniref:hypothetical protein n=1 Tax=Paracoccus sp. SSK6 TaxID=3143131 RepID=UPI0032193F79